jgi:signal transduction histidine kinase
LTLASSFANDLLSAKRYVEEMGGRIWVESEMGVGTTYHFTFNIDLPGEQL